MAATRRTGRAELVAAMQAVAAALAGREPDARIDAEVRAVLTAAGLALLGKIQAAFATKARGGTGDDGISWPPLTRATVAGRRTTRKELRSLGVGGKRTRGLLTPAEDKRWRAIFARTLAQLRARGVGGAEGRAAAVAWAALKASGAKTRLEVLGGRSVEMLRDTGALARSLTPGYSDGQVLEVEPGAIVVGSNLPYAQAHHAGVPGRIPARPFWPEGELPASWAAAVGDVILRAVTRLAGQLARTR